MGRAMISLRVGIVFFPFIMAIHSLLAFGAAATAQDGPDDQRLLQAFRSRNYRDAVTIAERAVAETKAKTGETHPQHIKALIDLGHVLMADNRFDEAQAPMKQAVDLASSTLEGDAPLLADALDGLGTSYMLKSYPFMFGEDGREAEPWLRKALAIREKSISADVRAYIDLVERLSTLLERPNEGQAGEEGGRILTRAIALLRQELGEEHLAVGILLLKYADVVQKRAMLNNGRTNARDAEDGALGYAEQLKKSTEAITNPGANPLQGLDAFQTLFGEAENYSKPGREIIRKALASGRIDSKTPLMTRAVVAELASIAGSYRYDFRSGRTEQRVAESERLYQFIRDLRPHEVNANYAKHLDDAWEKGVTGLMDIYEDQKRSQDLEAAATQLSAYYDKKKAERPNRPMIVGQSVNLRLARYYEANRDMVRAEMFLKQEIAVLEKGTDADALADALDGGLFAGDPNRLDGLAGFYERLKRNDEAEAALKRSIEIRTRLKGEKHGDVKELNRQLAFFRERVSGMPPRKRDDVEPYFSWLEDFRKESGPDCPVNAPDILSKLAVPGARGDEKLLGDCSMDDIRALAEEGVRKQIEAKRAGGEEGAKLPFDLEEMAASLDLQRARAAFEKRDWKAAYKDFVAIEATEFAKQQAGKANEPGWRDADHRPVSASLLLIKTAWQLAKSDASRRVELTEATFSAAQRSQLLSAASALGQMNARQASGSTRLASLLREREALSAEHTRLDLQLKSSVLKTAERNDAKTIVVDYDRMAELPNRIAAIDQTLAREFPEYSSLSRPQPVSIAHTQAHLKADEALVLLTTTPRIGQPPMPQLPIAMPEALTEGDFPPETFVWVVTKTDARWVKADLGELNIAREIFTLRCGLDTAYWTPGSTLRQRCEAVLRVPKPVHGYPPFHIYKAFSLYRALFGDVEDLIAGKHLLIAPSGPFTALPFQVLVTNEPGTKVPIKAAPTNLAAYEGTAWLGTRHPITVLPSVASFKALRERPTHTRAGKPFLGFGNPLLSGNRRLVSHDERAALASYGTRCEQVASLDRKWLPLEDAPAPETLLRGRLADVEKLREQVPLPETADELCTIARQLGASSEDVVLGGRMTETEIKAMSASGTLRNYRIVHFATHGLIASESATFAGSGAEPALLFTPPQTATQEDDGLLTASEVTQLELDADWVIMSACRTAAGEAQDAEALSGLARAFFYAGARALLVSHWAVESDAAVIITTNTFEALAADPSIGKAEALRRALTALQRKKGTNLHPVAWAPFSLVGGEAR
jgi:CHAT domain-containing protein